jgi:UDP-N-acetylglucosamine--N-acetylmuramyl-(pentapeptide) pyrophosphoryl-undecaprenol N-acetylglucosamine transferase
MTKKIIFAAGGTGGHIFPAIHMMKHFFQNGYEVVLVTDNRGKSFTKIYPEFKPYILNASTPTNKNIIKKLLSLFAILYSIIQSFVILKKERPTLIFGFGGYVSFPIAFVSKFFSLPLVIYENNLILGRTNKYLLPFSKKIFTAKEVTKNFPHRYKYKACNTGSILDKNIINRPALEKDSNTEIFSILVLGGSQGAEIFGTIIPPLINKIKSEGNEIKINQQCIKGQKILIEDYYKKNNIKNYVFEFERDILKLMQSSDLAITRCGASTTAELVQMLIPFIAIPLPGSIDNHQYLNAKYYEDRNCCWLLNQDNLIEKNLLHLIKEIKKDKNKLKDVCKNMKKNNNKNVYNDIENEIKKFV